MEQDFVGLHLIDRPPLDEIVPVILRLRPRVLKNYDTGSGYFVDLLKRLRANGFMPEFPIMRFSYDDQRIGNDNDWQSLKKYATASGSTYVNPTKAWEGWLNAVTRGGLEHLQSAYETIYVGWLNEAGGFDYRLENGKLVCDRLDCEREWAAQLTLNYPNLHAAALNLSTGFSNESIFKAASADYGNGLLNTLWQYRGIIDTHCYADLFLQNWYGSAQAIQGNPNAPNPDYHYREHPSHYVNNPEIGSLQFSRATGYLVGRAMMETEWSQWYGGGAVPVIVGETGFDRGAGFQSSRLYVNTPSTDENGWRDMAKHWESLGFLEGGKSPARFYAESLHWERKIYEPEPGVKGCAVFIYGGANTKFGKWRSFDIRDEGGGSEVIDEYISIREGDTPTNPDPPVPPVEPAKGCWSFLFGS